MLEKAKSPVIILIVLLLLSLSFAGGGFFLFQKEHAKNLALAEELDEIKTRLKITEAKLDESKKLLTNFENQLKDTQLQVETVSKSLEVEKSAKDQAISQITQLRSELEQQKVLRSDLEQKLDKAQTDVRSTQNQLLELQSKKSELENKVSALQAKSSEIEDKIQGVELGKIVVNKQEPQKQNKGWFFGLFGGKAKETGQKAESAAPYTPAAAAANAYLNSPSYVIEPPPTATVSGAEYPSNAPFSGSLVPLSGSEGKVLVVNKDYNFAVINLGSRDGLEVGDLFSIYKGDRYLGDAKVGKIHESMAALDFISGNIRDAISEGDRAIRKNG